MRILPLILALLPSVALACPDQTVLSCRIGKKQLEICQHGETLTYSFGPKAKPELHLTAAMADGPVEPWPGIGRSIWEVTRFHNQAITYEVWISFDKMTEDAAIEAGVNVLENDQSLAELTCDSGSLTSNGAFSMSDAMTDAGYCFDIDAQHWGKTCP